MKMIKHAYKGQAEAVLYSGAGRKESWKIMLIKYCESREAWKPLDKTENRAATPEDCLIKDEKSDQMQRLYYNKNWKNKNYGPI